MKLNRVLNRKSQILFVNHASVLGGAELVLVDIVRSYVNTSKVLLFAEGALRRRLHESGVATDTLPVQDSVLSIRASSGFSRAMSALPSLVSIARHIAKVGRNYDVIVANSQKAFVAAALAKCFKTSPLVWHLHCNLDASYYSSVNKKVAVSLANLFAARVIVNSKSTAESFLAAGGHSKLIRLVYNGIAPECFNQVDDDKVQSIRKTLGVGKQPLVGIFAHISRTKGHHVLLEAMKAMKGVHVAMVGDTFFGEDDYRLAMQEMASSAELSGRVHWLGFRDDIPELMTACDVIVSPSTEAESFGRVIVEGQLAGTPVIATSIGAFPELIEDGVTGCLVPPSDASALAREIHALLCNQPLRSAIAERGRESARINFPLQSQLNTYHQVIEEVVVSQVDRSRRSCTPRVGKESVAMLNP